MSEIVIGAKSKITGLFDYWVAKDANYDVESWRDKMIGDGYSIHEMHVDEMIEIIESYPEEAFTLKA